MSFLLLVMLGRLLGPDGLGAFAFAISWLAIAQIITTLGLQHYAVRAIPPMLVQNRIGDVRGFVKLAIVSCFALSICLTLVALTFADVFQLSSEEALQNALAMASILLIPLTLNQLRSGLMRGFGRPVSGMAPELVLYPGIQILLIAAIWLAGQAITIQTAVYSAFGAAVISLIVGAAPLIQRLSALPDTPAQFRAAKWLVEGGKSTILFAFGVLMAATDIVMLGALSSAEQVGLYAIAARFFALMMIPALAASGAVSHLVAEYVSAKKFDALSQMAGKTATQMTILAVVTASLATGPAIAAGLIFGPEFAAATWPILVMIWFRAAEAFFGHPVSFLANGGRIGLAAVLVGCGLGLNAGLNYLLIPAYGALGAAVATSSAHFVTTLVMAWTVWLVFNLKSVPSFFQGQRGPR